MNKKKTNKVPLSPAAKRINIQIISGAGAQGGTEDKLSLSTDVSERHTNKSAVRKK